MDENSNDAGLVIAVIIITLIVGLVRTCGMA